MTQTTILCISLINCHSYPQIPNLRLSKLMCHCCWTPPLSPQDRPHQNPGTDQTWRGTHAIQDSEGRSQKTRSSRPISGTYRVWVWPGLHKTVSQNKNKNLTQQNPPECIVWDHLQVCIRGTHEASGFHVYLDWVLARGTIMSEKYLKIPNKPKPVQSWIFQKRDSQTMWAAFYYYIHMLYENSEYKMKGHVPVVFPDVYFFIFWTS